MLTVRVLILKTGKKTPSNRPTIVGKHVFEKQLYISKLTNVCPLVSSINGSGTVTLCKWELKPDFHIFLKSIMSLLCPSSCLHLEQYVRHIHITTLFAQQLFMWKISDEIIIPYSVAKIFCIMFEPKTLRQCYYHINRSYLGHGMNLDAKKNLRVFKQLMKFIMKKKCLIFNF